MATYDRFATAYRDWWAPVIAPSAIGLLDRLEGADGTDGPMRIVDIGAGTGTLSLATWPGRRRSSEAWRIGSSSRSARRRAFRCRTPASTPR